MAGLKAKIAAELSMVRAQLPIGKDPASREVRKKLFSRFDPNGNGILSLAEVDMCLSKHLQLGSAALCKPAISRAFNAARTVAPPVADYSNNYISRSEFRYLLVYLRHYLELWKVFANFDTSGDRRVRIDEFKAALPKMVALGIPEASQWQSNPDAAFRQADRNGGGFLMFDEFADFCLRNGLGSLSGGEDEEEKRDAIQALAKKAPNLADASTYVSTKKPKMGRTITIDWATVDSKLPVGKDENSKASRRLLFNRFDPNGNGILSLSEVDYGLTKVLQIGGLQECKPAINRAFHAARALAPPVGEFGNDYIDKNEFRVMLIYLRRYLELWQLYNKVDANGDRHVRFPEFKNALPLLKRWGLKEAEAWEKDPKAGFSKIDKDGGGIIRFVEFADYCLRNALKNIDDASERREAQDALQKKRPHFFQGSPGSTTRSVALRDTKGFLDIGVKESLRHLLRDECQGAIDHWAEQVGEAEMRGLIRLARKVDGMKAFDPLQSKFNVPTMMSRTSPSAFKAASGLSITGMSTGSMSRNASAPAL